MPNAQELLGSLLRVASYYIGIPQQRLAYESIIKELRRLYRECPEVFSPADIQAIIAAKNEIEATPDRIPPPFSLEAGRGIKDGDLVYHRVEHYAGRVDETTKSSEIFEEADDLVEYRVVLKAYKKQPRMVASGRYLEIISSVETALDPGQRGYRSQCWRCQLPVGASLERCLKCGWFKCFHCEACGCEFPKNAPRRTKRPRLRDRS